MSLKREPLCNWPAKRQKGGRVIFALQNLALSPLREEEFEGGGGKKRGNSPLGSRKKQQILLMAHSLALK